MQQWGVGRFPCYFWKTNREAAIDNLYVGRPKGMYFTTNKQMPHAAKQRTQDKEKTRAIVLSLSAHSFPQHKGFSSFERVVVGGLQQNSAIFDCCTLHSRFNQPSNATSHTYSCLIRQELEWEDMRYGSPTTTLLLTTYLTSPTSERVRWQQVDGGANMRAK